MLCSAEPQFLSFSTQECACAVLRRLPVHWLAGWLDGRLVSSLAADGLAWFGCVP